jgi:hypothetical protein
MSQTQQATRRLVTRKGRTVDTPYTDRQAFDRLEQMVEQGKGGDFAADLIAKGITKGLSDEQFKWVHILVVEAETPRESIMLPNIASAYRRGVEAGVAQRNMKILVGVVDEQPVQLSVAGRRSKHCGSVWVTLPQSDTYCGRIGTDNVFYMVRECPAEVREVLEAIEANPAEHLPW